MHRKREEDLNHNLIVHQRMSLAKVSSANVSPQKKWKPIGVADKQIVINECRGATILVTHGFFWLRENLQEWLWSCSRITPHRNFRRI